MKLSILTSVSVAALAFATPALAQSTSNVTQNGGGQVTIDQSGSRGSRSDVVTLADPNLGPNTVNVTQRDNGTGPAGTANISSVNQDNVNLGTTATVNQNHTAAGYDSNRSYITQGRNASNGDVYVEQTGGANTSTYSANTSTDNLGDIRQNGVNNNSAVVQDFQNGARAYVNQTGGYSGANSVNIQQVSTGFASSPTEFANGAFAQATQNGDALTSDISQTGFSDPAADANFARTNQTGYNQYSSINQTSELGSADVYQSGQDHESYIDQSGRNERALVVQEGTNNTSNIDQNGTGANAEVRQSAANNSSYVLQNGNANTAYVSQSSNGNTSNVSQLGSSATASVNQH